MKSACLPPPPMGGGPADRGSPACPVFSSLVEGSGTGFFVRGGGLLATGRGGGGNGRSPLPLLEAGGGGGTKSGGGSQKSDGGVGKSIFSAGGGAGKLSGSVRKTPLSRLTLEGRIGETEIADDRLSGGGGGCSEFLLLWYLCDLITDCARPGTLMLSDLAFNKQKE